MKGPIVLIGPMGSGKTAVGDLLSKRMGWEFIDLDHLIEARTGMDIDRYFREHGERGFRELESHILDENMGKEKAVISCGGGIVTTRRNLEALQSMEGVVLLFADGKTLAERLGSDSSRPLLQGHDKERRINEILGQRKELYLYAADIAIDTAGKTIEEVVDIIIDFW
ncbi:MAG TPA: shikimate kinase [Candidatus Methanofastidiosa archaeon]|nr:shikimate kinase [Candidatus Methanofastidiosa archaeon]